MIRILIIDDDKELCELLSEYLELEGFQVEYVYDGDRGIHKIFSERFDLVVLDVMLPELSGFEVLRRVRTHSQIPIIMLTARGDEVDRIVGLEMGADDYLPKPFNPRELAARIRAVLRRVNVGPVALPQHLERVTLGDVELDPATRCVWCNKERVELTTVEFDLLHVFLREAGRVISREELAKRVLGRTLSPYDRSIDVHVSNLRKKLGPKFRGVDRIKAVRGAGYIYTVPSAKDGE